MSQDSAEKPDLRRIVVRNFREVLRTTRRQLRRLFTHPSSAVAYARYRAVLRRHDWIGLRAMIHQLAETARRTGDTRMMMELGQAALRLDEPELSVELIHLARAAKATPDVWRGEELPGGTLVIHLTEKASQGVGDGLELSGYFRAAAACAGRAILIAERRLVPVFARTLPDITVLPFGADIAPYAQGEVRHIGIDELRYVLGFDTATVRRLHVPLIADAAETRSLRENYLRGRSLPLIGIAWWSSHYGKDLPPLAQWQRLIESLPAQFISLQYGEVDRDVAVLRGGSPDRLLCDETVDQMANMDRFASQLAALDLVVTISNSGAHLAGALGKRMIVVRDDLFRRSWPYLSREVPWYPGAMVIVKNDRPWDAVFDEIIATAKQLTGL
jgi:hypothetical protein